MSKIKVLKSRRVIDGYHSIRDGAVVILDDKIIAVGSQSSIVIPDGAEVTDYGDNIIKMSEQFGISTDTLQIWQKTAELTDVSLEAQAKAVARLNKAMYGARDGVSGAAANFEKLGISIFDTTGQLRRAEDVFPEIIRALSNM